MKNKVVVTGGAGFIGSNLADALVEEDFEVHIIDNLSGGKKENVNPKAKLHVLDITDLPAIKPVFAGATYVFHLAALPRVQFSIEHPAETNKANVEGTLNVLIAASEAGVKRVIYSASSSAYGDQDQMPLKESMPAHPKSPYGLHKYLGELYCKLWNEVYGLSTVSLRYFNVYGPRNNPEGAYALVIAKFLRQRTNGEPMTITGDGEQTRDFTNVKDVARANLLAMKSKKVGQGEVINIGAGHNCSINQIVELIGGPAVHIDPRFEPRDTLADNSLAKKLLNWKPNISIEEGINELKKLAGLK
ncbi:MAG: NAD-dependent epimerase/dehydratase family protein [Candidatus Moraniibacteriota bacterium]